MSELALFIYLFIYLFIAVGHTFSSVDGMLGVQILETFKIKV